jgi:antitoxin component YwqK of YwqJK toxin-antitoxin module
MIKRVTIILIALFIAVSLPSSATAQIITVELSKIKDKATGQMIYHLVYKRGVKIIAKRSYSDGKTILSEGRIPDGMVVENYPDGKVKNIMYYKNGKRNGPAISLFESGRIKAQAYYEDGNPTGKGFYYFESGALKTEFENKDGKTLYHYEYTESGKRGKYRTQDGKDVID